MSIDAVLSEILAKSASLAERIHSRLGKDTPATADDECSAQHYVDLWCNAAADGNWENFQKRLRWDGLESDAIQFIFASNHVASMAEPVWLETMRAILQRVKTYRPDQHESPPLDAQKPLPFQDLLLPICQLAREKLLQQLAVTGAHADRSPLALLATQAIWDLERSLLAQLVHLCTPSFFAEFSAARPAGHHLLALLIGELPGERKNLYYQAFVQQQLSDGLSGFFKKYPVLARLTATTIAFWVATTAEFLQRLKTDWRELQQTFALEGQPGVTEAVPNKAQPTKVGALDLTLSDPHHCGRTVIVVQFETGAKLVYKPKDLGLDAAFVEFLHWCNARGAAPTLRAPQVLCRDGYGWAEFIEQLPCQNETAVCNFYHRAGMLLCLLYVLDGTDCHHENLIAHGDQLILIDMEALLHHNVKPLDESAIVGVDEVDLERQFWDSVLRTGLLPRWDFGKDNQVAYDVSGLGSLSPQPAPWRTAQWKAVNTDDMQLAQEAAMLPVSANVPIFNGQCPAPNDYLEYIVAGFQQMYTFLEHHAAAILSPDGPFTRFAHERVRFVFRPTRVYGAILQRSLAPELLQDGVKRSIELELLSRAFVTAAQKPTAWPILQAEIKALEQLDIPYFAAFPASDALTLGVAHPLQAYFAAPSYHQARTRLEQLGEQDMRQQTAIIRDSFYARVASVVALDPPRTHIIPPADPAPLTSSVLIQEAMAIAQQLQARAIRGGDGGVNWIGLTYVPKAERYQLQPLAENLYDGRCGVALFLAALYAITEHAHHRQFALDALLTIQKTLQSTDEQMLRKFAKRIGIGGAVGLGSIIYALVKVSKLANAPALLADARRAARLITPERIAADRQFDIIEGAAGAILGLLALYREIHDQTSLATAVACAEHLLSHRTQLHSSLRAWKTVAEQPSTGFSHGAAGIAYALLQLYELTHTPAFYQAAAEGIHYETSVYSEAVANWPHINSSAISDSQSEFRVSWCSGAPGIGLARLGGWAIYNTEAAAQDIENALSTTQTQHWQGVDHLCCGNFGRIDTLLTGAQILSHQEWYDAAQRKAAWVIARARRAEGYQLFANLPGSVFNPGLFQGLSGIGYQLLRLAVPEKVTSVLLWQ